MSFRSASFSNLFVGVPTVINTTLASFKDSLKLFDKEKRFVELRCLTSKSSKPGSKNGHTPLAMLFILD